MGVTKPALLSAWHASELAYLGTALVAAYFAYIQHALVILSAFSPRALEGGFSVTALLDAKWAEQFDTAFPPPHQGNGYAESRGEVDEGVWAYASPVRAMGVQVLVISVAAPEYRLNTERRAMIMSAVGEAAHELELILARPR